MNIFYDLETTGLEMKNQILSASFILTDDDFEIIEKKNFNVALNPLEVPAESAIVVNAVDITKHMHGHSNRFEDLITEEAFAQKINRFFISTLGSKGNYNLVGYNSNKFDIKFLRKVLIKYGYNPYYNYNKFGMIDILNHIKYIKCIKPKEFAKLENLTLGNAFDHLLSKKAKGLHEAESDVISCIEIAKALKSKYKWDIIKNNSRINSLNSMKSIAGDILVLLNPYSNTATDKNGYIKYQVHDSNGNYILLKCIEKDKLTPYEDGTIAEFKLITKNDFCLAKFMENKPLIDKQKSIDEYFSESPDTGVENFIYDIKWNDFDVLYDLTKALETDIEFDPTSSKLNQIKASQIFSRARPIHHIDSGVQYDHVLEQEEFKKFFLFYYEKYIAEEMNKEYKEVETINSKELQLIREYKAAYKELYDKLLMSTLPSDTLSSANL